MIVAHHVERIFHRTPAPYRNGVVNHSVLGSFHHGHFVRLFFNRHVFVYHADASFACYSYGHGRLGYSIHSCRNERDVQFDIPRELCFQRYRLRQHVGVSGYEQDVVVCKTVHHNFICNK